MRDESDVDKVLQLVPNSDWVLDDYVRPGSPAIMRPAVITLDRRPDRWAKAMVALSWTGIPQPIKFKAVDGRVLPSAMVAALVHNDVIVGDSPNSHLQLTRPAIGCFLSHLQVWKQFIDSGAALLWVLEDDAVPAPDYTAAHFERIRATIPTDADIVLLGCSIMGDLAEPMHDGLFRRVYYFNGTYAYLVTRRGCLNLSRHLLPLRAHIDHQISGALIEHHDKLVAYAAVPSLFGHDFSVRSDAYVPLANEAAADRHLGRLIATATEVLRDGGRLGASRKTASGRPRR